MVRGKGKRILTYSERMQLQEQKKDAESLVKEATEPGRSRGVDVSKVKAEIAYLDQEIHNGTAGNIRAATKDKMAARAKELEKEIKTGMPTRLEMTYPAKNPGAVGKHMAWSSRNKENIKEYKEIQRQLNPDAPVNVDSFRKEK